MSRGRLPIVLGWLLLLLLASYPRMSLPQEQSAGVFQNLIAVMSNFYNFMSGGLNFLTEDARIGELPHLDGGSIEDKSEFDFVVVGAGSAGAVVAARLSEVKSVKVLLLEAGPEELAINGIPLLALYQQLEGERISWAYRMKRSSAYCRGMRDGRCRLPRGKIMGGSSTLNLMIATRANRRQFDQWARRGCEGWAWEQVLPLFRRMENFEPIGLDGLEPEYHGRGGPLNIAYPPYHTRAAKAFLEAARELGYRQVDYNGREQLGFSFLYGTVKNGSRQSSSRAYLLPARKRPNLRLMTDSHVEKILISPRSKRAFGVSFSRQGERLRAIAKKEVILCAGAINSPQLLMLSGIGPRAHLRRLRIPVLRDAPVGNNLGDHVSYWGLNFQVNESVTLVASELFQPTNPAIPNYLTNRQGPLTMLGGAEAAGFIDLGDKLARRGLPNMELLFAGAAMASDPLIPRVLDLDRKHYEATFASLVKRQAFMILPTLLTPKSRGRVRLQPTEPLGPPVIVPNYFSEPDDMRLMVLGIREALRLVKKTNAMKRYDARLPDNPIIGCETEKRNSDGYWECAVRTFADTLYHPSGTCKMGPASDPTAVVDPRLKVFNVTGLRVADASILPEPITGHPNVVVMMVGEKLAEMVKEDWDLV